MLEQGHKATQTTCFSITNFKALKHGLILAFRLNRYELMKFGTSFAQLAISRTATNL